MEYCKNAFGYVCKVLINYCINSCKIDVYDDSLSKPYVLNDCYCNCTNQINYYRYCYNDNVNYQLSVLSVILRVLFLCFVLCIVCGLCRYRIALYNNNKKRALMPSPSYNSLDPPPYQNYEHEQDTTDNLLQPPPIYSATSEVQQSESRHNNIDSSIQIEHVHHFTATSNSYA